MTSMPAKIRIETAWSDSTRASAGLEPRAEKTGRAHQEDHDHHRERERVPVGRREYATLSTSTTPTTSPPTIAPVTLPRPPSSMMASPLSPTLTPEERAQAREVPGEEHAGGAGERRGDRERRHDRQRRR